MLPDEVLSLIHHHHRAIAQVGQCLPAVFSLRYKVEMQIISGKVTGFRSVASSVRLE